VVRSDRCLSRRWASVRRGFRLVRADMLMGVNKSGDHRGREGTMKEGCGRARPTVRGMQYKVAQRWSPSRAARHIHKRRSFNVPRPEGSPGTAFGSVVHLLPPVAHADHVGEPERSTCSGTHHGKQHHFKTQTWRHDRRGGQRRLALPPVSAMRPRVLGPMRSRTKE